MIDRVCISLTSKCQLSCTYCYFDKHIDKSSIKDISEENLQKILENLLSYAKVNNAKIKIGLVGSGEPLLRFDLIEKVIDFCSNNDFERKLSFYTISNGINFDEEKAKFFFKNKERIKLCFSIDGNSDIHNLCRIFRNKKGSFDKVMKSVELYKKIFGESPAVNSTVHKKSFEKIDEVLNFFESNFYDVTFSRLVDVDDEKIFLTKNEFSLFMKNASEKKLRLRQLNPIKKYDCTMYGQNCGVGRTNIFFDCGKIYPCGRFVGKKEFELGCELDSIFDVEERIKKIIPCEDGKCFFDENLKG